MKNIKYVLFTIIFLFSYVFYVDASCTEDEITNLKNLADNIKITYKHMGEVKTEDYIDYNRFKVTVSNMSDDFYITFASGTKKLVPIDGVATVEIQNGDWNFIVYSNKCDVEISLIEVFLPRFNMYSLDPLCDGIDSNDFPLCGKYYEYDVDYENFKDRVNYYRVLHNISNINTSDIVEEDNRFKDIINKFIGYIFQYQFYILTSLVILLIIIFIVIIMKRRRKRGVLE